MRYLFIFLINFVHSNAFACYYTGEGVQEQSDSCTSFTYPDGSHPSAGAVVSIEGSPYLQCFYTDNPNPGYFAIPLFCEFEPPVPPITPSNPPGAPNSCERGSIIMVEKKSVGESIEIVDTPFFINYMTHKMNRVVDRTVKINLKGALRGGQSIPASTSGTIVRGQIYDQPFLFDFPRNSEYFNYTWDGLDRNGQPPVYATTGAFVSIEAKYNSPQVGPIPNPVTFNFQVTALNFKNIGLGGWTFNVQHFYDQLTRVIYYGDGTDESAPFKVLTAGGDYYVSAPNGDEVYVFNDVGRHLKTLFAKKGTVKYTFNYNADNFLTSITDFNNLVTTITRDSNNNPTSIIGHYGRVTTLAVDTNGYLRLVRNPNAERHDMTYTSSGLISSYKNPRGVVNTFSYDSLGRLLSDSHAAGSRIDLSFADLLNGTSTTTTSAMGLQKNYSTFTNVSGGPNTYRTTRTVASLSGESTTYLIQSQSGEKLNSEQTTNINTTLSETYAKDPRLGSAYVAESTTTAVNSIYQISESRSSQVNNDDMFDIVSYDIYQTETNHPNGPQQTSLIYDGVNSIYKHTSPLGRLQTVKIDSAERPTTLQYASDLAVNMIYDSSGRLSRIQQGNRATQYFYNARGEVRTVRNALGQNTNFTYDRANRPLTQQFPDGRTISYAYDKNGNLISLTPPGRTAHDFTYNNFDLLASYLPNAPTTWAYDNDRKPTSMTRPDGRQAQYIYDETTGRLTSIATPAGNYSINNNGAFQLVDSTQSPDGVIQNYDYNGSYLASISTSGAASGSMQQTYNNSFLKATSQVTGGTLITYSYDNDSLLSQAGDLIITRSASNGRIARTQLSRIFENRTFTTYGELRTLRNRYLTTRTYHDFTYTRDKLGRITNKLSTFENQPQNSENYIYDSAGRLVDIIKNGQIISHSEYDSNSNRILLTQNGITTTATYDDRDQILTFGSLQFTHNANGELTSITNTQQIPSGVTNYSYDVFGNLKQVVLSNGRTISYVLDGLNRRVGKKINGNLSKQFLWQDNLKVAAELNAAGNIVSQFIYATSVNSPDYMIRGNVRYKLLKDHLGSILAVVHATNGNIIQQLSYDEFGKVLTDTNPGFQPFGFAGGLYDNDTQLVRFGAREYNATIARWMTKDPILFNGGDSNLYGYVGTVGKGIETNLYGYSFGDPVNFVDANGEYAVPLAVGFFIGIYLGGIEEVTCDGACVIKDQNQRRINEFKDLIKNPSPQIPRTPRPSGEDTYRFNPNYNRPKSQPRSEPRTC